MSNRQKYSDSATSHAIIGSTLGALIAVTILLLLREVPDSPDNCNRSAEPPAVVLTYSATLQKN